MRRIYQESEMESNDATHQRKGPIVQRRRYKSWTENRKDEIIDDIKHPDKILPNIQDDVQEAEEDVEWYWSESARMARRIQRFNLLIWLINMAAFAAPFTFVTFICWIGNIVLNIWMN